MLGNLVKYSQFYNAPVPENPLELIEDIPKEELIITISGIIARFKPLATSAFNYSKEKQIECIRLVFLDEKNPLEASNCLPILFKYRLQPPGYSLFTRVTCLYALQEIINHDNFTKTIPAYTFENRERIFKFLLLANDRILSGDKNYLHEGLDELGDDFIEFYMFRELHHNQYNQSSNAINIFYKSFYLFNKLENNHFYSDHFKRYLTWKYRVESTDEFIRLIIGAFIQSEDKKLGIRYLNVTKDNVDAIKIFDAFAATVDYEIPAEGDLKKFDFFPLKKSPLYKCTVQEDKDLVSYIVLDDVFFIEKAYSIFINDFWFDYLKPNGIKTRNEWGSFIGTEFFEPFIEEILKESLSNNPNAVLRSTNQLLFNIEGSHIEYADFYIREKQKIALFEVKSGFLPLEHGYKTVSTIDDYRNLDLDKFYKDYGLVQLAEKTIKKFHLYKNSIDDPGFNRSRKVHLYPVIVINDPVISSGMVPFVLKRKFNELLEKEGINKKEQRHLIKDLCVMNISHLQEMEQKLKENEIDFFEIMDYYLSISELNNRANFKGYQFLRAFDQVLGNKLKDGLISSRIRDLKWLHLDE